MEMAETRILHISKYYYPFFGGTEQVARDMVRALLDTGAQQKVICFNEDANDGEMTCKHTETKTDMIDGVEVVRCGYVAKVSSQAISLTYAKELKKVMDTFKPGIVILHYPNPFVSHFLLKYAERDFKLIVYWHLDITKQKVLGKLFGRQNMRLLGRADKVVATSPNYIDGSPYLSQFREKCTVVPNCVQTERLAITPEIEKQAQEMREKYRGRTICFAIGRHVPYKGMTYLVQASKYLDDSFKILIGGSGPLTESLKEEARGDDKIEFLGRVSDKQMVACYAACDIFCFPSITKNEAFGIALAEGMYFGKPAVTFTIEGSGVNYVSLDGVTGIECPNCDIRAYAKALLNLSQNDVLRKLYGDNARQRVLDNFTSERFKSNLVKLIGEL